MIKEELERDDCETVREQKTWRREWGRREAREKDETDEKTRKKKKTEKRGQKSRLNK